MEQTDTPLEASRPKFLTVLCILSFIATGWGILGGLYSLATAGKSQEAIDEINNQLSAMPDSSGFLGNMLRGRIEFFQHAFEFSVLAISSNLLCLLGVLMMWNLKKMGYYLYIVAQLAGMIAPFFILGSSGSMGPMMMVGNIFPIAFIIMYGVNLKHMA